MRYDVNVQKKKRERKNRESNWQSIIFNNHLSLARSNYTRVYEYCRMEQQKQQ